jgi:predicted DNA-binding WGR domain protein
MSGVTINALSHPEFLQHFEVRLLRSHAYHEYTRLFEGELIRLCMRTSHGDVRMQSFWPLLFNRQGGLDGTHDWGETHVCVAFTKRPLHQLMATGELYRVKPPWAGLQSGFCQRTLCEKLRAGQLEMADGEPTAHPFLLLARAIDSEVDEFEIETTAVCVRVERLVCIGTHKVRKNSKCFYVVQQWAMEGDLFGITNTHGRISKSGKGRMHLMAIQLTEQQATSLFNKIVLRQVAKGYQLETAEGL